MKGWDGMGYLQLYVPCMLCRYVDGMAGGEEVLGNTTNACLCSIGAGWFGELL